MKLEVGQYVRTKDGRIYKIKQINGTYRGVGEFNHDNIIITHGDEKQSYRYKQHMEGYYCDILKSSRNLIDLIQEGDYVNGYKITDIDINALGMKRIGLWSGEYENEKRYFEECNIKSIVTKEQFKSMQYEVK